MKFGWYFILQGKTRYILTAVKFVVPEYQDSSSKIFFRFALDHEIHVGREKVKTA